MCQPGKVRVKSGPKDLALKLKEAGAWQRTIGLGYKAGARPRTRRVLDKTKRAVGSMAKLEHVQNMNRPSTKDVHGGCLTGQNGWLGAWQNLNMSKI